VRVDALEGETPVPPPSLPRWSRGSGRRRSRAVTTTPIQLDHPFQQLDDHAGGQAERVGHAGAVVLGGVLLGQVEILEGLQRLAVLDDVQPQE
jgi:hypothetical protein